jgi:hypothetical protein
VIGSHILRGALSHSLIRINCWFIRVNCASMCLAIWLYSNLSPALTQLGNWRSSLAPSFDQLCFKGLESTLKKCLRYSSDLFHVHLSVSARPLNQIGRHLSCYIMRHSSLWSSDYGLSPH